MVRTQGESVDIVEKNIFEASDKTADAKEQMEEAKKQAHSARKKKLCLILIGIIVAAVILILIIFSLLWAATVFLYYLQVPFYQSNLFGLIFINVAVINAFMGAKCSV